MPVHNAMQIMHQLCDIHKHTRGRMHFNLRAQAYRISVIAICLNPTCVLIKTDL